MSKVYQVFAHGTEGRKFHIANINAEDGEHALHLYAEQHGDSKGLTAEEKPYEGPWCVCLYLVDRAYGGPEEGGWYYGCGTPVIEKGLPLPSWHDTIESAEGEAEEMDRRCDELNKGRRDISSVLSEGIYQARVCEGTPKPYPETKPHYE